MESEFNDVDKCTERTWDMIQSIAAIKGWRVEEDWIDNLAESDWGAIRKLEENWFAFRRDRMTSEGAAPMEDKTHHGTSNPIPTSKLAQ